MLPFVFLISPIKPCNKLVFPLPTGPTRATNVPLWISILMSLTWNTPGSSTSACSLAFSWEFASASTFVLCLEGNLLFLFVLFFPSSSSGGGVSQVNVASLTWMATGRSSLTSCVFSSNSASKTSESREAALAASVMELKARACSRIRLHIMSGSTDQRTYARTSGVNGANWKVSGN